MQLLVMMKRLKELRNRILRTILVWSLLCLIRLCVGLHFLRFLSEIYVFVFLYFLWIKSLKYASSDYVILTSSFVLTLYKNPPFINNKLIQKPTFYNYQAIYKSLQYYVKTCSQRCFLKNSFIKKSVEQS